MKLSREEAVGGGGGRRRRWKKEDKVAKLNHVIGCAGMEGK